MSKEIIEEIEKAKSVYSGYGSSERYEKLLSHLDQVLELLKQQPPAAIAKAEPKEKLVKTVGNVV